MMKLFQKISDAEPRRPDDTPPLSRLEAALFLSREPLPVRRLALLAGLEDAAQARELVQNLNRRYRAAKSAFCVVEVADGFQLRTHPEFASWLFRLQEVPVEVRLTRTAMETLAIVAYQQPILRAQIERIRGAACGDILRQLMDQNLIQMVGRLEEPGRPILYGTTKRFLQVFGLTDINALPSYPSDQDAPDDTPPPSGETAEEER
ncbi:MAG: SMC-Scp complex subunit ScpB [Thermoguttaceae bacterium]|nr:SMC-Scp complex subunit ScpB [Thermoguttaceae bacterium]